MVECDLGGKKPIRSELSVSTSYVNFGCNTIQSLDGNSQRKKVVQKPHGYWTLEPIEDEATEFYVEHEGLSRSLLGRFRRGDLFSIISTKYPGRMTALKTKLGINLSRKDSYWAPTTVETEARTFMEEHGGKLSSRVLLDQNRGDLLQAVVHHYPGNVASLQEKLGVPDNQ